MKKKKNFYVMTKDAVKNKYYISGTYTTKSANNFVRKVKKGGLYATKLTGNQTRKLPRRITQKIISNIKRRY